MTNCCSTIAKFWDANSGEFISALAGAFFGALAAYWFQRFSEKKKQADTNHAAILRAQLALISQINILENFRRQTLDPLRNDPERFLKMLLTYRANNCIAVDYESLSFLLDSNNATLLLQVQVAERGYQSAMDAIDERNLTMKDIRAHSDVAKANMETGQFTVRADPRDIKLLKDNTDALYSSVDHAEKICGEVIAELNKVGKHVFPKRRFLSLEEKKTPNEMQPNAGKL